MSSTPAAAPEVAVPSTTEKLVVPEGMSKKQAKKLAKKAAKKGGNKQPEFENVISFDPPSGTRDFFPEDMRVRNWLFSQWRAVSTQYGFSEYDAPVLENEDLYKRKAGEEIVEQMYNFVDKEDHRVTLRPEMTPTLARMVLSRVRMSAEGSHNATAQMAEVGVTLDGPPSEVVLHPTVLEVRDDSAWS
ncbi:hypothetical protein FOZ62_002662 [Perkinsus olseni]|uniref:histidine--tRNA ligase n=1 Tax=Perkinsus olseni TaxID=32597 RepID=A0A7J6PV52_PEROL|nr:hypothetical protein FOZ62_002662 [Perkinsus olseni]